MKTKQEKLSLAQAKRREVVRSYFRVRQALGWLGLSLPVLLIATGAMSEGLAPSVSDFFHTLSRDVYVGVLVSIGIFLLVYEGYDRQPGETLADNWIATIAGISVIGVALFPNESPTGEVDALTQHLLGVGLSPAFHYSSAFVFFYCMGHFCMFRFSKTHDMRRRRIYRLCGWAIIASCAGLFIATILRQAGSEDVSALVTNLQIVFWVEVLGIWAFSLAWIVKGRGDKELLELLIAETPFDGRGPSNQDGRAV